MTKLELIGKYGLSSKFSHLHTSDWSIPNFKHNYYYLTPKFSILCGNNSFEYM